MQERVINAWLSGADFHAAKVPSTLNPLLLETNASRFVRKNTSDFFVHPQLSEFLSGELDVYLKQEFVQVWDAPDTELPRIRAKYKLVRDIALDLIAFLAQIESFQATLFEKRKFVLQADYLVQCSWLLREAGQAGQALVAQACASCAAQTREWALWVGDKAKKPNGKKLLAAYPHLPLHTRHFDADFKARVLACFDDIEAALGGELLHADNYAALRTLEPAYRERVKCIYIDPPYNTGNDGFVYKDNFAHGSWLSPLDSRSRKFIEGWSSFRVSTLGLLQIGRNAGTQVIQLFGRGVRLAGVGGRLKRAAFVPELGPHPTDIALAETLYVFGVNRDRFVQSLVAKGRCWRGAGIAVHPGNTPGRPLAGRRASVSAGGVPTALTSRPAAAASRGVGPMGGCAVTRDATGATGLFNTPTRLRPQRQLTSRVAKDKTRICLELGAFGFVAPGRRWCLCGTPPAFIAGALTHTSVIASPTAQCQSSGFKLHRHALRQGTHQLVADGAGAVCHFVNAQHRAVGGTAPQRDLAAKASLRQRRQINHQHVHADASDGVAANAVDQYRCAAGADPGVAIRVAAVTMPMCMA